MTGQMISILDLYFLNSFLKLFIVLKTENIAHNQLN